MYCPQNCHRTRSFSQATQVSLVQCFIAKYIFWLLFHVLCFVIIFVMYIIVIHWSACLMCTLEHHHHHPWMDMPKLNVETEELPQCYCYTVYPPKHIIAHSMALKLALKWLSIMSLQSFSTLSASQDWDFPMQCILFVRWIILFWLLWEKKHLYSLVCMCFCCKQAVNWSSTLRNMHIFTIDLALESLPLAHCIDNGFMSSYARSLNRIPI